MADMIRVYDHRKYSPQSEPAYPMLRRGLTCWLDAETHLVVNSNVADKIIYLHGQINSSSHTLP